MIHGLLYSALLPVLMGAAAANSPAIDFSRDIQPILSSRCYTCHGPEKQKSGLRLDLKESALAGGESGVVIVAGDPDNSLLITLVSGLDSDRRMPSQGEPLSEAQIASLKAWIAQGATWPDGVQKVAPEDLAPAAPDHWAFQPIRRPEVPLVSKKEWVRSPIDAFVLAKLEAQNIAPSPEADKTSLARRLYLDLLGLPPTPQELDDYLNDLSPQAYEALVDRLLASPHFGERWARHWLDLARYADSDGYQVDQVRPYAYLYRDWVIGALNRDMPYDQFVTEQLAGDLLPNPTLEQVVATGFHRNTLTNKEGGIDPEEDRSKQNIDRTNTTASVFLGLTMACAQCHSHKYDPITQREYYKLYGFFNVSLEKDVPAASEAENATYHQAKADFNAKAAVLQKEIDEYKPQFAEKMAGWEKTIDPATLVGWDVAEPVSFLSNAGTASTVLDDRSLLLSGNSGEVDTYTVVVETRETGIKSFRLQALKDKTFKFGGPGRALDGTFVLSEFSVFAAPITQPDQKQKVNLVNPKADYEENGRGIDAALDGDPETGWSILKKEGNRNEDRYATFDAAEPVGFPEGTLLTFVLEHRDGLQHNIGRLRLSTAREPAGAIVFPDAVHEALMIPGPQRTPEQQQAVYDYYSQQDPEMKALRDPLDTLLTGAPEPPKTAAQTLAQNPTPPKTHVFTRGDFLLPGDEVQLGTPAVLPALRPRGGTPDRLDLAHWIAGSENPLTSRVVANRIWQHLFGRGIVSSPDDFGTRGDKPTHPELLDWLATELVRQGWSMKGLIRTIVTSSTYRQSSANRTDLIGVDPANYLLARQNRYHVEAEIVRDVHLAASGLLCSDVGGPSIRPPQPVSLAESSVSEFIKWEESPAPDKYRRGLYIHFQRSAPYPMLTALDCPESIHTVGSRTRSNTPLQALTLLNNPVFFECAQALGARMLQEGPPDEQGRIRYAFRLCMGREPEPQELKRLEQFLSSQRRALSSDQVAAIQLVGKKHLRIGDIADTASCVALARVIMNLDEFVTRE